MISAVVGFVALLRRHGFAIGPDRATLATRALALTDLADRNATRRTLRLTLLLNGADTDTFNRCFAQWFSGDALTDVAATLGGDQNDVDSDDQDEADAADPRLEMEAPTTEEAYVDDPSEQVAIASDTDDEDRHQGSGDSLGTSEADVISRFDAADSIGTFDHTASDEPAERGDERDGTAVALATDLDSGFADLDELRRLLDRAQTEHRSQLNPAEPSALHALRPNSVLANPFDRDEQRTLDAAVRAMWPQLIGAPGWRRRRARSGQLDLRRTLRTSVTYGGVPVDVQRRAPVDNRPDVLVLVDTSASMRPSVRLMLHLAHALRCRPGRVRVLGFVDTCVDVTGVIHHADLGFALGGLLDDAPGGPLDPARPSDYGTAFASLRFIFQRLLRPTTSVIILGDGRSNGRDPGYAHVEHLVARCRYTVWCTPEPVGAWGFGNGEMAAYAERVDAAITMRSLDDLAVAASTGVFSDRRPIHR